jgi:membrane peptidoglycan carboxypeptidase
VTFDGGGRSSGRYGDDRPDYRYGGAQHGGGPGYGGGYRPPGYGPGYGDPGYGDPGYGDPGYGDPGYGEPAYGGPAYGGAPRTPEELAAARDALGRTGGGARRRRRRRGRRLLAIVAAAFLVLLVGVAGVIYAAARVPLPAQIATKQISTITYADGTVLARIGPENRTDVPLKSVPEHVRWAVLSAENRTFYTDHGISPKGIVRAAWNDLRGRDVQGGSGITQQYVKNAYLTQQRTLSRKFKELVISVKVDRQYAKDQILEWYLNTIYFGRGAYGIQAAAQTYFGKDVGKLTVAEGAVLAASIRSPALYDPQAHPDAAKVRWRFVLDGMVTMGKLTQAEADAAVYPKVRARAAGNQDELRGWAGLVVQQVKDELARDNIDEATLNAKGVRVVTTIDRNAQSAAMAAVKQVFTGQPRELRQALVAVEPNTGRVLAYYGGSNGNGFDYAQGWRAPGSSFKPYTLATALEQTIQPHGDAPPDPVDLHRTYNGSSPRTFNGVVVRNSGNAQCNPCTVLEAMKRSINTVFYDMALQVGPRNVADTAHRMGVPVRRTDDGQPTLQLHGTTDGSIGIGRYEVRPIDQAVGFSVFATGGILHQPYFVQKVTDSSGAVLFQHKDAATQVLDRKVANDVTYALEPVAGWSHDPLDGDRPSAAKTGTQQYGKTDANSDAWMVGFTPQVSAAVWVGTDKLGPIRTAAGREIYGAGLPGQTWKAFMDAYLASRPVQALTDQIMVHAGVQPANSPSPATTSAAPRTTRPPTTQPPTPTATPSPSPSTTPSDTGPSGTTPPRSSPPSPSPTASPTRTKRPPPSP